MAAEFSMIKLRVLLRLGVVVAFLGRRGADPAEGELGDQWVILEQVSCSPPWGRDQGFSCQAPNLTLFLPSR